MAPAFAQSFGATSWRDFAGKRAKSFDANCANFHELDKLDLGRFVGGRVLTTDGTDNTDRRTEI
jgi:hypothetical protein